MRPFFLITIPRVRADLLIRTLNGTPGVSCAGESGDVLDQIRKNDRWKRTRRVTLLKKQDPERFLARPSQSSWAAPLLQSWVNPPDDTEHFGVRDSYLGNIRWKRSVDWWSWLLITWPDAVIIFLTRDIEEVEVSLEFTSPLWIPSYGSCGGCCLNRVRATMEWMQDFNFMNPERTLLMDSADLLDYDKAAAALGKVGIPFSRESWEREIQINNNSYRILREKLKWPEVQPNIVVPEYFQPAEGPVEDAVGVPLNEDHELSYLFPPDEIPVKRSVPKKAAAPEPGPILLITGKPQPPVPFRELYPPEDRVKVSVSIMAHPKRLDHVAKLKEQLGDVPVALDEGVGLMENGMNAWRLHDPAADYHVVVQDDVVLCADFMDELRRILSDLKQPMALSLYYGSWKQFRDAALRSREKGFLVTQLRWGPALVLPTAWINEMLEFFPKQAHPYYDKRIGAYLDSKNRQCLYPIPSLVNHLPVPSLLKHKGARPALLFRELPPEGATAKEVSGIADVERAIVYPYLDKEAVWEELRYSLRSVETHFEDKDCPIYILGDKPPEWLIPGGRVRFIRMDGYDRSKEEGHLQAHHIGMQLAAMVLWMNDDICLLKSCTWEEFERAIPLKEITYSTQELLDHDNGHRRGQGRAARDLLYHGLKRVTNFSSHAPYLFHRDKSIAVMRKFHLPYSGGYENLYYNWHQVPKRMEPNLRAESLPAARRTSKYLNYTAKGPNLATQAELMTMFPDPPPWERGSDPVVRRAPLSNGEFISVRIHSNTRVALAAAGADTSWSKALRGKVTIYGEDDAADAYLRHIIQNWDTLEDYTIFLQGDPFAVCKDLGEKLRMLDWLGKEWFALGEVNVYAKVATNLHELAANRLADAMGLSQNGRSRWLWSPGSCFVLSDTRIRKHDLTWWKKLREEVALEPEGSRAMERLWGSM